MKKSNIKRSWKVGNSHYSVHFRRKMKHRCRGLCDGDLATIEILQGMDMEETLCTLIHEMLHAIEFEYGLRIPHSLIYKLEKPILLFIIDNYL